MNGFNLEKLLNLFNIIFYFITLNFLCAVLNIPFIFFIFFIGFDKIFTYFPLFLVCLLPFGTTLSTIFYCMNKYIKNKGIYVFKDFFKGLKSCFFQSIFIWSIQLIFYFILYFNIKFFSIAKPSILIVCFFASITIIILLTTPYIYLLISKFKMTSFQIVKSSLILAFTNPIITISNSLSFLFILILFGFNPPIVSLVIFSLLGFIICFNSKNLLNSLEKSCKK